MLNSLFGLITDINGTCDLPQGGGVGRPQRTLLTNVKQLDIPDIQDTLITTIIYTVTGPILKC